MDAAKLEPILTKESTLKTAKARELQHASLDVLNRYNIYALTHIPLGDTAQQLNNLRRVVVENKNCAVGTIVGPYGYGKTSTAVHLWNELRQQHIMAIPPFEWANLTELMEAVYYWIQFEFSHGPATFVVPLDDLYARYRQRDLDELSGRLGAEETQKLIDEGRLLLKLRPEDVVEFFRQACELCEQAGYHGMVLFTDELQATLAGYLPSRDQFFADLFAIVKEVLGLPGHWAWVLSMNDDTEGMIARLRADLLQRLQRSALYFRVKDVYDRREYPAELWGAFEKRFGFDGSAVILPETLEAIGQIAVRNDLGAGPRMVTYIFSLAVKHYDKTSTPYTPFQLVDNFLAGQVVFDQRGKFATAVRKALGDPGIQNSEPNQRLVKLLAAYPIGCSDQIIARFDLTERFRAFPPLARRELILQKSGGYILRYLAEEEVEPEQIEQRLIKEFVGRYVPGKSYAIQAAEGFMQQVLLDPAFASGWKRERQGRMRDGDIEYQAEFLRGTFDAHYPDRMIALLVAAVPQSPAPQWQSPPAGEADIEMRFELNYALADSEPSRMLVSPKRPNIVIFQLNLKALNVEAANKMLPGFLYEYYSPDQLIPLLNLALIHYLYKNRGELPDDQNRISSIIAPLRQYVLWLWMNTTLETVPEDFASTMVGVDLLKDLFRQVCRRLYPTYQTLVTGKNWDKNLQQYNYALEKVITEDGLSIARGRRSWTATKEAVADAFRIPGRRLTNLEALLDTLEDLIEREEFSGRSPTSEVKLKFKLHPLEEEWLEQLEASRETVKSEGIEAQAVPAEQLLRQARKSGYTDAEVQEVLRLLQSRQFVNFDQRRRLLIRAIDKDIDLLREAVDKQLEHLEQQIQSLTALPEFDPGYYPLSKLRSALEQAKERDEIEAIRGEARQYGSNLNAFASARLGNLKEKSQQELAALHELMRQGIPEWLRKEFIASPLHELLEKQRRDLAGAYQAELEGVRVLREGATRTLQEITGPPSEMVVKTYTALIDLSKQSRVLRTRLQSYEDRHGDVNGWRRVSATLVEVSAKAHLAQETYGNAQFIVETEQLLANLRTQFETQPLTVLGLHTQATRSIQAHTAQITTWLEGRRQDFENRCTTYRQDLAKAGIEIELHIPFDQERPAESYRALNQAVSRSLRTYRDALLQQFHALQQAVRYAIQVQHLSLGEVESHIHPALNVLEEIEGQMTPEVLEDYERFKTRTLARLMELAAEVQRLTRQVQDMVQPKPPEGTEVRLMQLLTGSSTERKVDLRGLITQLLDSGEENVEVEALMRDLASLFQKSQISIHIHRLH